MENKKVEQTVARSYGTDGISLFINDATSFSTIDAGYDANLEDEKFRFCVSVVKKGEESLWYYLDLKKVRVLRERLIKLKTEIGNEAPYRFAIEALKEVKKKTGKSEVVDAELKKYGENLKTHFLFSNTYPVTSKKNPNNNEQNLAVSLQIKYCGKYAKPIFVEITHYYGTYDKTAKWHIKDTQEIAKLSKQLTLEDFIAMVDQTITFGEAAKGVLLREYIFNRSNSMGE